MGQNADPQIIVPVPPSFREAAGDSERATLKGSIAASSRNGGTRGGGVPRTACRAPATGILLEGVKFIADQDHQEWSRLGDAALVHVGGDCGSAAT